MTARKKGTGKPGICRGQRAEPGIFLGTGISSWEWFKAVNN